MSDPRRLLNESSCDLERALLRSARRDEPARGAKTRTLAAIGISAAVTATSAGTASAASGGALLKWIALAACGAVGVALGAGRREAAPPTDAVDRTAHAAVAAAGADVPPPPSPEGPATEAPEGARPEAPTAGPLAPPSAIAAAPRSPTEARGAQAARGARAEGARPDEPTAAGDRHLLAEELRVLDGAREALLSGSPDGALAALDDHGRRFGVRLLDPEATVLRIEALVLRGDAPAARALAREFLRRHPGSPHAGRVRSLALDPNDP